MRGSVMKRGSTWTYVISLGHDEHGKRKQKWVGGHRTRKEAEDAMIATLERIRTGSFIDPGASTLKEYLDEWLAAVEPTLRITTWRSYEQMLRLWVIPRGGRIKLADLTPMHLRRLQADLLKNGKVDGSALSHQSVANCRRALKKALSDAVKWGLLAHNPMTFVDAPRVIAVSRPTWGRDAGEGVPRCRRGHRADRSVGAVPNEGDATRGGRRPAVGRGRSRQGIARRSDQPGVRRSGQPGRLASTEDEAGSAFDSARRRNR